MPLYTICSVQHGSGNVPIKSIILVLALASWERRRNRSYQDHLFDPKGCDHAHTFGSLPRSGQQMVRLQISGVERQQGELMQQGP
jgi:hypothetical protein